MIESKHLAFVIFSVIGIAGCGEAPAADSGTGAVETVRHGVLATYKSTTVGKAFEGTFQNPKWTAFETPKGQTVVQFEGTIRYGEINKMTGAELTNAYAMHTNDEKRVTCASSSGATDALDKLKQDARASKAAYERNVGEIRQQYSGKLHNFAVGHPHSPFDNQPFVWSPSGGNDYPFKELDAARRDELNSEKQAVIDVNEKVAKCMNATMVPVKFQFMLSADKKRFTLDYVDDAFGNDGQRALEFVYR